MTKYKINWFKFTVEVCTIVFGILLAFALDAWWNQERERGRELVALESLAEEFSQNLSELATRSARNERTAERLEAFQSTLDASIEGTVVLEAEALTPLIQWATSDLATGTLDGLLVSGELGLISNATLRTALASWPAAIEDAQEDEILAQQFVEFVLTPSLLGQDVVKAAYLARPRPLLEPSEEALRSKVTVAITPELIDLTAARLTHIYMVIGSQTRLETRTNEILAMINGELGVD